MPPEYSLDGLVTLSTWDLLLVAVVTIQATALAYVGHPRWKAFILTLPIPFSLATLSLGLPVGATNVLGLLLLFGYTIGVYWLHVRLRVPVVPSIVACAAGYCGAGTLLARYLPRSEAFFWLAAIVVYAAAVALYAMMPPREEPSHRSPLPVPLKAALIAMVVLVLVVIKQHLQGFMTVFPMVGVVASYEGRHCLWTLARQIPVLIMVMLPMMVAIHLLQPVVGHGWALAAGWAVFLSILVPFTRRQWAGQAAAPVTADTLSPGE